MPLSLEQLDRIPREYQEFVVRLPDKLQSLAIENDGRLPDYVRDSRGLVLYEVCYEDDCGIVCADCANHLYLSPYEVIRVWENTSPIIFCVKCKKTF